MANSAKICYVPGCDGRMRRSNSFISFSWGDSQIATCQKCGAKTTVQPARGSPFANRSKH